ncbi:hypothetical protein F4805DRAFT_426679 [Annulohypoxylon moriforme]|nr:hypothetical protein F4805DRAFT_426679 [Annulohypoxylon moriforme]
MPTRTMFEYIIKTSPSGRHHHHHHHHDSHYRAGITVDKWNGLVEQNHELASSNETLKQENRSLKSELQTVAHENARLFTRNQDLTAEVCSLRRSRSTDSDTAASFRRRIAVLSKENMKLATRVDVLSGTVSNDAREIGDWRRRADEWKDMYEKIKRTLKLKIRDLEDSNRLIEQQRRRLRYFEHSLPFGRGRRYSYS